MRTKRGEAGRQVDQVKKQIKINQERQILCGECCSWFCFGEIYIHRCSISCFANIVVFSEDLTGCSLPRLDMGFIQSIGKGRKEDNMVLSIIEMAHRMDMKVVAEGVETAEQLSFLRDCDCDYIQGYYFSKPLLQEEYARGWMRNNFQIVRS